MHWILARPPGELQLDSHPHIPQPDRGCCVGREVARAVRLRPCEPLTAPAGRSLRGPLCRLPLPIRCGGAGGPLVPALRPVLPRPRGATRRAWRRGRPCHHLSVVLRFTPLLADAARPCRHRVGDRWQVGETYVKVAGQWRYFYRGIDQFGQVIDVFVSSRRDAKAAQRCFERAIGTTKIAPAEVTTDQAPVYPAVLENLLPAARHCTDQYANNRVECDHGRLKARLRPMRGLKQDRSARVVIAGMRWCRTFAADTTSWRFKSPPTGEWRSHSTNWSWRSDPAEVAFSLPWIGATQQRRPARGGAAWCGSRWRRPARQAIRALVLRLVRKSPTWAIAVSKASDAALASASGHSSPDRQQLQQLR
jgi:transposase-like protein